MGEEYACGYSHAGQRMHGKQRGGTSSNSSTTHDSRLVPCSRSMASWARAPTGCTTDRDRHVCISFHPASDLSLSLSLAAHAAQNVSLPVYAHTRSVMMSCASHSHSHSLSVSTVTTSHESRVLTTVATYTPNL